MAKKQGRLSSIARDDSGFSTIDALRDGTFTVEKAEIGSTARDDGSWESFLQGRKSASLEGSFAWDVADTELTGMIADFYADTERDYRWRMDTIAGEREYTGSGIITGLTKSGPNDDLGSLDVTIRINGQVTEATQ